ncbi:hypothetical protein Btru_063410 [Bulinus truncatus]|nr:hypothetical protein Btru_063410 [Bulinus truncatus]
MTTPTAPSSEKDDVYFLEKLDAPSFDMFDASEPPPPKKNTRMKNTPRLEKRLPKAFGHLNFTSFNWSEPLDREKRATLTDYYIDVAAIVDYTVYSRFLTEASHSSYTALRNIREHYAFVFTGIDMLYQSISNADYRINVRLCKVYVTETRYASAFIDDHATSYGVGAATARDALQRFVHGNGNSIVGNYDHAMLFTGHDLYLIDNNYRNDYSVVGIAYIGTMCSKDGTSISVIEDRSGYSTIDTAAHEMGHSLSAQHDGLNNRCSFSDRYIMAASNSLETETTKFHPWQFSPCSIAFFSGFLSRTVYSSRGYDCLGFILNVDDDLPDVSNRLLGQEVTPDQQCKQLHGSSSYYCRDMPGINVTDICHAMYCQDPQDYRMCYQEAALVGTSCGDGKICINGQCVSDPYAPQLNEDCMFGDQLGYVYMSYTCSSFVKNYKGVCYDDVYNNLCCSSCGQIYQTILGCEYGDSVIDCKPSDCTRRPKECCHTCHFGTPFTTTITTRRTTPARTSRAPITTRRTTPARTSRAPITTRRTTAASTSRAPITTRRTTAASTSSPDCHLGDKDLQPDKCTSSHVCKTERNLCCEYCRRVSLYNSAVTLDVILPNLWAFCFIAFVVFKKN